MVASLVLMTPMLTMFANKTARMSGDVSTLCHMIIVAQITWAACVVRAVLHWYSCLHPVWLLWHRGCWVKIEKLAARTCIVAWLREELLTDQTKTTTSTGCLTWLSPAGAACPCIDMIYPLHFVNHDLSYLILSGCPTWLSHAGVVCPCSFSS